MQLTNKGKLVFLIYAMLELDWRLHEPYFYSKSISTPLIFATVTKL